MTHIHLHLNNLSNDHESNSDHDHESNDDRVLERNNFVRRGMIGHEDAAIAVHKSRESVINNKNTGSGIIEHKSAAARSVDTAFKEVETNSTRTNLKPTKNVVHKGVTRARAKAEAKKRSPIRQEEITKVHVKQLPKKQAPKRRSQQGRTTRPQNFGHAGRKVASSGLESNDDEETLQWSFVWPKWNFNPFGNVRDTTSNIRNTALRVSNAPEDEVLESSDRKARQRFANIRGDAHEAVKTKVKTKATSKAGSRHSIGSDTGKSAIGHKSAAKGKPKPSASWQSTKKHNFGTIYVAPSKGGAAVDSSNLGVTDDKEVKKTSEIIEGHLENLKFSFVGFKNWFYGRSLNDDTEDDTKDEE